MPEECGGCGETLADMWKLPPCGRDCPYFRAFSAQECELAEAKRRLGTAPTCRCSNPLKSIEEQALDPDTGRMVHLVWECTYCDLTFSESERTNR